MAFYEWLCLCLGENIVLVETVYGGSVAAVGCIYLASTNDWRATCRTCSHVVFWPGNFPCFNSAENSQKFSHVPSNIPCQLQADATGIYYIEMHSPLINAYSKKYWIHPQPSYYLDSHNMMYICASIYDLSLYSSICEPFVFMIRDIYAH